LPTVEVAQSPDIIGSLGPIGNAGRAEGSLWDNSLIFSN
jgi:hypothetical protein